MSASYCLECSLAKGTPVVSAWEAPGHADRCPVVRQIRDALNSDDQEAALAAVDYSADDCCTDKSHHVLRPGII